MDLLKQLQGKKTYLVGAVLFIVAGAKAAGLIDPEIADQILTFLGSAGLLTLRAAVAKSQ